MDHTLEVILRIGVKPSSRVLDYLLLVRVVSSDGSRVAFIESEVISRVVV